MLWIVAIEIVAHDRAAKNKATIYDDGRIAFLYLGASVSCPVVTGRILMMGLWPEALTRPRRTKRLMTHESSLIKLMSGRTGGRNDNTGASPRVLWGGPGRLRPGPGRSCRVLPATVRRDG